MRYKDDWEITKKRFAAFWDGEILDRCCISVKAFDSRNLTYEDFIPESDEDRVSYWTDTERIIRRNRRRMEHTYYGGESFPAIFINLGASGHAGFFKGEKHYFGESVWFFPSLEDPAALEFDENSFLYRKTIGMARAFADDSRGDYVVSMPDGTGNADALSHLMGPENLMMAMLEDPDGVQGALAKINDAYKRTMAEVYSIVKDVNDGGSCVDWLSTWAPGFHAQMQSDMSVMISKGMFDEFVLPELQDQCRFLEYPLYHFDGIEQIRHLDSLLSIPELRAIQWTQVVGQPPVTEYIPYLKKIQAAGKNVIIHVSPEQIAPLMENLSSRGLFLITSTRTRDEADAIIKQAAKLTRD